MWRPGGQAGRVGVAVAVSVAVLAGSTVASGSQEAEPDGAEVTVAVALEEPAHAGAVAASVGANEVAPTAQDDVVQMQVSPDRVAELESDPRVSATLRRGDGALEVTLAQSVAKVGAPGRQALGFDGSGETIVVIDTGVSGSFGGALVGQACFAAEEIPGQVELQGLCQGGAEAAYSGSCFDLGVCQSGVEVLDEAAGAPCQGSSDCQHGSAVAAVAARRTVPKGVAPGAGVYAIRVFDDTGDSADLFDVWLALEHVIAMVDAGMDVSVVNMSVSSSSTFTSPCDSSGAFGGAAAILHASFRALKQRDVPVVVASGNNGQAGRLGFPACLSSAIAVGATDLDDRPAPFGDRGPGLDMFAPGLDRWGSPVDALDIPNDPAFGTQHIGTSFSAPHVAGAFALLSEHFPYATADQRWWYLARAGVKVSLHDGRKVPRLMLRAAADVMLARVLFPAEARVGGTGVPRVGDFDGDGRDDILVYRAGAAADLIAYGRGDWSFDVVTADRPGTFIPLVGNFRGAAGSPDDILWYGPGAAADYLWVGSSTRTFSSIPVSVGGSYQPHVGNFDGDGWDDIFWYAPGPAPDYIWFGGPSGFTSVSRPVGGTYRIGIGDFDKNGSDDIFFHGPGAVVDTLWRGRSNRTYVSSHMTIGGSYQVVVLDQDGNGFDDVILYGPKSAPDYLWTGGTGVGKVEGGTGGFGQHPRTITERYTPFVADFDSDGRDDVFWYQSGPTRDAIWFGRPGPSHVSRAVDVSGSYQPVVGDFNGDRGDDVVWFGQSATPPVWWSYLGPG